MDHYNMERSKLTEEFINKMYIYLRTGLFEQVIKIAKGEMFILNHLENCDAPVLPSELSIVMSSSTARIAAILNGLENKGYITREMDKTDRRKMLVTITELGREVALEKRNEIMSNLQLVFDEMGQSKSEEFLQGLTEFLETLSKIKEEGRLSG